MLSEIHGWSGYNGKEINPCSHWKLNLYHPAHCQSLQYLKHQSSYKLILCYKLTYHMMRLIFAILTFQSTDFSLCVSRCLSVYQIFFESWSELKIFGDSFFFLLGIAVAVTLELNPSASAATGIVCGCICV